MTYLTTTRSLRGVDYPFVTGLLDELLRSHDELRAAVIVAGKRVRKLQFGRRNDEPVLVYLQKILKDARAVRRKFGPVRKVA